MTKKLRYATFIVLALILSTGIYAAYKKSTIKEPISTPPPIEKHMQNISLSIDYGDGNIYTYEYQTEGEKSVYDVLKEVSEMNKFVLDTQEYDFGILVTSISGIENTSDKAWIYFVNGESGQVAADKYMLKDGDKIEWKYIAPIEE